MRAFILAAAACAALLAGCGSGDEDGGATTATGTSDSGRTASTKLRIKDFEFDPTPATVKAGQRISVANADDAPHTLTEEPAGGMPLFDTGTLKGKATGSFQVTAPGSYEVYCVIHPFMKGEIEVVS